MSQRVAGDRNQRHDEHQRPPGGREDLTKEQRFHLKSTPAPPPGLCLRYATIASRDTYCCRNSDFISATYSGTASQYCQAARSCATNPAISLCCCMNIRYDRITRSRGIAVFALPCTDSASSAASISGIERLRSRRYVSSSHATRA